MRNQFGPSCPGGAPLLNLRMALGEAVKSLQRAEVLLDQRVKVLHGQVSKESVQPRFQGGCRETGLGRPFPERSLSERVVRLPPQFREICQELNNRRCGFRGQELLSISSQTLTGFHHHPRDQDCVGWEVSKKVVWEGTVHRRFEFGWSACGGEPGD